MGDNQRWANLYSDDNKRMVKEEKESSCTAKHSSNKSANGGSNSVQQQSLKIDIHSSLHPNKFWIIGYMRMGFYLSIMAENFTLPNKLDKLLSLCDQVQGKYRKCCLTLDELQKTVRVSVWQDAKKKIQEMMNLNTRLKTLRDKSLQAFPELSYDATGKTSDAKSYSSRFLHYNKSRKLLDQQIEEFSQHLEHVQYTSFDGYLVWKVNDYDGKLLQSIQNRCRIFHGVKFYTSTYGYQMVPELELCTTKDNIDSYISIYICFYISDFEEDLCYPVQGEIVFELCNLEDVTENFKKSCPFLLLQPNPETNPSKPHSRIGLPKFVPHSLLHSGRYVKNGDMYIKISVKVEQEG